MEYNQTQIDQFWSQFGPYFKKMRKYPPLYCIYEEKNKKLYFKDQFGN